MAAALAPAARAQPRAPMPVAPLDINARNALLLDFDTGAVMLDRGADELMPPASMSKLMTMYVVFDLVEQGRLAMDQTFLVSAAARAMGGSRMFLEQGSRVSIEDLARGVIIQSGNDACVALAEGIAGSEAAFVDMMNTTARRIGLTASTFRNTTGLPHPEHRMTPRDIATLARRLILDFPRHYSLYAEPAFTWNNIRQANRNPLLGRVEGADGLKTGHTSEAGYCLVASVQRGRRRLIMVVGGLPTERARAEESERIISWGFREFVNVVLFNAADTIDEVPVYLGERRTVPLVAGRELVVTVPRDWRDRLEVRARFTTPVTAPVLRGQELGRLEVGGPGVAPMSLPLYAGADVDTLNLFARVPAVARQFLMPGM